MNLSKYFFQAFSEAILILEQICFISSKVSFCPLFPNLGLNS
jgi:hypothetical protein